VFWCFSIHDDELRAVSILAFGAAIFIKMILINPYWLREAISFVKFHYLS
jgi:hypothetical protein